MCRKRRWTSVTLMLVLTVGLSGCMWKKDHVKIVNGLKGQINKLQKNNDDLQAKLTLTEKNWGATKKELAEEQEKNKRMMALKQRLESQIASLTESKERCLESVKALSAKRGELGQKLRNAIEQIERLQAIAKKRKALFDRLRASLQNMVRAGKLKIVTRNGMFVVALSENILFASGKARVKKAGKEAIEEVTGLLKSTKRRWQVTGHTDDRGNPSFNWSLSARRAMAVVDVMLKAGMPAKLISGAGFGQYQPAAPNDSRENRALNRRTEIVLVPNLAQLNLAANPSPFWICKDKALAMR